MEGNRKIRLIAECPLCESRNIIESKLIGNYNVYVSTGFLHHSSLISRVCLDCGNVVQIYAEKPEKLIKNEKKKNRF